MTTISIHRLVSLNGSIPNRGADGLPKSMSYGGVLRSRVSSQCIKAALRETFDPGALGLDTTVRSTVIGEQKLLPAFVAEGMAEPDAIALTNRVISLFTADKKAKARADDDADEKKPKTKASNKKARAKAEGDDEADEADETSDADEDADRSATLVLGEREIEALIAVGSAWRRLGAGVDLRKAVAGKIKAKDMPKPLADAITTLHSVRAQAGMDGALFGRMATGVAVSRVDSAVHVAHAMGVGAVQSTVDFWSAQDQLSPDAGAGHINTREIVAGVFLLEAHIDVDQVRRNITGLSDNDLRKLLGVLVRSVLEWQPKAMIGSTAPYADPGEALVVVTDRAPLSMARAFERPCEHVTDSAWARLVEHAERMWARTRRPPAVLTLESEGSVDVLVKSAASAGAVASADAVAAAAE